MNNSVEDSGKVILSDTKGLKYNTGGWGMIRIRQGTALEIIGNAPGITNLIVEVDGQQEKAVNYDQLTGAVGVGDKLVLNTTAVAKGLGTGGTHFVMANLANHTVDTPEEGHIMKMRYAPHQVKCFTVDEQDSPYIEAMQGFEGLQGMPVVVGTLHSQLPLVAAGIKESNSKLRVAYLMTDGAALPIAFSNLVRQLVAKGLIDATITTGHAFGGDYEAVNNYTGLIAAREVVQADVTIVTMGPGIVGTGSKYGFTGIEQGEIINAVNVLGGQPVAVPRISFADARERHRGISHHTLTVLDKIALTKCFIPIPQLVNTQYRLVREQLDRFRLGEKHEIVDNIDALAVCKAVKEKYGLWVTTMGRKMEDDQEFFLAAGAAGILAARMVTF